MTPQRAAKWLAEIYAGDVSKDSSVVLLWEHGAPELDDLLATAAVMGCFVKRESYGDMVYEKPEA